MSTSQSSRRETLLLSKAFHLSSLALAIAISACSSSNDGTPDAGSADSGTTSDAGVAGDPNTLVGGFQVKLVAPLDTTAGYTAVVGKIYDGPTPQGVIWEDGTKSGDCKIERPRVPSCATPCGGSALCVKDDTCQSYPTSKSVGNVTVTGIHTASGATQFSMSPVANNYQPTGATLPYPAFAEGDDIRFAAEGGAYAAFAIQAKGVAPLEVTSTDLALQSGQALTVTWTPAGANGASTIHVKLDISHHGGSKGMIECDTADTGSVTISADLMTELIGLGVAGFPSIIVTRKAVGSTVIAPGRVDLVVSSEVEKAVTVPGVTSCTTNDECSNGQTCQADLTCK